MLVGTMLIQGTPQEASRLMSRKTPASVDNLGYMLETVARKRRQKGGFLLRLLGRALEHFHGDFPSAHKRCGTSRASHKRDAVLADDHLRLFYAHCGPFRDGQFIGNLRPFPIVRAELFEKILDGDPLIFLLS